MKVSSQDIHKNSSMMEQNSKEFVKMEWLSKASYIFQMGSLMMENYSLINFMEKGS